jgi:7-cyano-7-deazaguanine reductase
MLNDLVTALDPHWCKVTGVFNIRGGIGITVEAEHTKTPEARAQWTSQQAPEGAGSNG